MMDDNEQCREVYARFGLAVYMANVLEHGLVNLVVISKKAQGQIPTRSDCDAVFEKHFAQTMGTLLREASLHATISTELQATLDHALKRRNFLCHRFFYERAIEFMATAGRDAMIAELIGDAQLFEGADLMLGKVLEPVRLKIGLTDSVLLEEYAKLMANASESDAAGTA
jgi:hypothetical protein